MFAVEISYGTKAPCFSTEVAASNKEDAAKKAKELAVSCGWPVLAKKIKVKPL